MRSRVLLGAHDMHLAGHSSRNSIELIERTNGFALCTMFGIKHWLCNVSQTEIRLSCANPSLASVICVHMACAPDAFSMARGTRYCNFTKVSPLIFSASNEAATFCVCKNLEPRQMNEYDSGYTIGALHVRPPQQQ